MSRKDYGGYNQGRFIAGGVSQQILGPNPKRRKLILTVGEVVDLTADTTAYAAFAFGSNPADGEGIILMPFGTSVIELSAERGDYFIEQSVHCFANATMMVGFIEVNGD